MDVGLKPTFAGNAGPFIFLPKNGNSGIIMQEIGQNILYDGLPNFVRSFN